MAITLILRDPSGTSSSQTVNTGASVAAGPSTTVQIVVNGEVIDPNTIPREVNPPDVTLTLPDGQRVTLTGFIDFTGTPSGGLAGADGAIVVAASLEALSAPAAGGTPTGGDTAGDNNISTFNQALIGPLGAAFGEAGDPFDGLDPAAVLAGLVDSTDPNEFLTALLDALGVTIPLADAAAIAAGTAAPAAAPPSIDDLSELFTPGDDTVDLSDITAVLTQAGLDPTDPAALAVFLLAVAGGFNISDALAGDDTVELPSPGDTLFGLVGVFGAGAGNDVITGGTGGDSVLGQAGEDILYGEDGEDDLDGGIDADVIYGDDGSNPLGDGTGDDDVLFGDSDGDTLYGEQGADLIYGDTDDIGVTFGQGEGDIIYGGVGNDIAYGGDDRDDIYGGEGDDVLYGDDGDNFSLQNVLQSDRIFGGPGEDTLYGEEQRDTLAGGDGTDTMFGGTQADTFLVDSGDTATAFVDVNRIEDFAYGTAEVVQISNTIGLDILVGDAGLVGGDPGEAIVYIDLDGGEDLDVGEPLIVFLDDVAVGNANIGAEIILNP